MTVESLLGLGGVFGEEVEEETMRFFALASGGFKEAAQDGVVFQACLGTGSLDGFTHDDHGAEAALGLVVGGRDVGVAEAGEEELLFRAVEALAKGFGSGVAQGGLAKLLELATPVVPLVFGRPSPPG